MKQNLTRWISQLSLPAERVTHCWEKTGLFRAWDPEVQREAIAKAGSLFGLADGEASAGVVPVGLAARAAASSSDAVHSDAPPMVPAVEPDNTTNGPGFLDEVEATVTDEQAWEVVKDFFV